MNEALLPPADPPPQALPSVAAPRGADRRPWVIGVVVALSLAFGPAAFFVAWQAQQRVQMLEPELVRRQHESATQAAQARLLADQAQSLAREAVAKATLLDTRVAEIGAQRSQLEELIQSLSRSRDENVVADLEAGLRVALQQTAITGSATPLVAALKSADERLQRLNQPRLEAARRAIARDLDRVKAASVADLASLASKLDEAVRLVDELPLLVTDAATVASRASAPAGPAAKATARPGGAPASAAAPRAHPVSDSPASWLSGMGWWPQWATRSLETGSQRAVAELRSLVRVTRIDQPQAMLLAPEQGYFLRENLKLRLLNARLALLSRQFDTAQSDVQAALGAVDAHFERGARKTVVVAELLRSVGQQAKQSVVPRPDETLATLAAAAAGR